MKVDNKYFEQKFSECSKILKGDPKNIVSLKYREIRNHHFYEELFYNLKSIDGLQVEPLGQKMNGISYKISYGMQNFLLVDHETGLEILYISGSVASLIALILQIISMIGDRRNRINSLSDVEKRYYDKQGKIKVEHQPFFFPSEVFLLPQSIIEEIEKLNKRVKSLEKKIKQLTNKKKVK